MNDTYIVRVGEFYLMPGMRLTQMPTEAKLYSSKSGALSAERAAERAWSDQYVRMARYPLQVNT